MGTNTIDVRPGKGFGDRRSGRVKTLTADDAKSLESLPFVDSVTPSLSNSLTVRYANQDATASVEGVGEDYFRVRGYEIAKGQFWDEESVNS
ncbi:ABC transporter permease, partial [Vibrio parahaemolyticus]